MGYYSTIKRNKVLIHGITEMKLEDMLSKEAIHKRPHIV